MKTSKRIALALTTLVLSATVAAPAYAAGPVSSTHHHGHCVTLVNGGHRHTICTTRGTTARTPIVYRFKGTPVVFTHYFPRHA